MWVSSWSYQLLCTQQASNRHICVLTPDVFYPYRQPVLDSCTLVCSFCCCWAGRETLACAWISPTPSMCLWTSQCSQGLMLENLSSRWMLTQNFYHFQEKVGLFHVIFLFWGHFLICCASLWCYKINLCQSWTFWKEKDSTWGKMPGWVSGFNCYVFLCEPSPNEVLLNIVPSLQTCCTFDCNF